MTQHTPGPWYATTLTHDGETYSHVQSASINEDNYVARVDVMDEQGEANAALIAAAPAMLEALRQAHSALRTFSPNVPEAEQGWTSFDSDTLEAIEAAIAAAEKESN